MPRTNLSQLKVRIPKELHEKFGIIAPQRGFHMDRLVAGFIRQWLAAPATPKLPLTTTEDELSVCEAVITILRFGSDPDRVSLRHTIAVFRDRASGKNNNRNGK